MFNVDESVVCVDDKFANWAIELYDELPVKGRTYTIRKVFLGRIMPEFKEIDGKIHANGGKEDFVLLLKELHNKNDIFCKFPQELGFVSHRFVPLEELSTEQFTNTNIPYQDSYQLAEKGNKKLIEI